MIDGGACYWPAVGHGRLPTVRSRTRHLSSATPEPFAELRRNTSGRSARCVRQPIKCAAENLSSVTMLRFLQLVRWLMLFLCDAPLTQSACALRIVLQ